MRTQAFAAAAALMAGLAIAPQTAAAQQYRSYQDGYVSQQQYCQRQTNNRTAAGAAIGGVAGAVLGSQAAARGHRTDGSVLGAVLGAVAGGMIGHASANNTQCRNAPVQGSYDPYYGQPNGQYNQYGDNDELYGGPYQQSGYYGDDRYARSDCRMGQRVMRDPYGREYREDVMMCRDRNGNWYPQG